MLGDDTPSGVVVRADGPVVVAQELVAGESASHATSLGVPIAATMSRLEAPDVTGDVLTGGEIDVFSGTTVFPMILLGFSQKPLSGIEVSHFNKIVRLVGIQAANLFQNSQRLGAEASFLIFIGYFFKSFDGFIILAETNI